MKKTMYFIIPISILIIVFLFAKIFIIFGSSCFPLDYDNIREIFEKDKDQIFTVCNYLAKSEHKSIYIASSMNNEIMSVGGIEENIMEVDVIQAIKILKDKRYSVIIKNENTIYFQRWSDLDSGRGVAYSADGKKPQIDCLIYLEPLQEENWYYYEEDYDMWRSNNYTNGIPNYLLGEWSLRYATERFNEKEYPMNELYTKDELDIGVKITFNSDGTFIRAIGNSFAEIGTYRLSYDDKILLKWEDGTQNTVKYLAETEEIVFYTHDARDNPINEYYKQEDTRTKGDA